MATFITYIQTQRRLSPFHSPILGILYTFALIIIIIKRQFVRRCNMSVDITRAPYRQSGNVIRDSSTETRLWVIWPYKQMGFQGLFKFVKCWRAPDIVRETVPSSWRCNDECTRETHLASPFIWNSLPAAVCEADRLYSLKCKLKTHLFTLCINDLTIGFIHCTNFVMHSGSGAK